MKNAIIATDKEAQYDQSAKRLLGQKIILAHILVKVVEEFKGMKPTEVVPHIVGTPYISQVLLEPGLTNTNYDDIKAVYSIWICMNTKDNTMSHIHLTKQELIGNHEWRGNLDLMNIVMIGLSKKLPEHDETYDLHRLLMTLLSDKLTVKEKLGIVKEEYEIPIEDDFRREVDVMCNLSQGIKEDAIAIGRAEGHAEGRAEGHAEGRASELLTNIERLQAKMNLTIQEALDILGKTISEYEDAKRMVGK